PTPESWASHLAPRVDQSSESPRRWIIRAVEPGEVVAQLWRRIQARDWFGVGELLAEDFVLEWPHDRVRLRGRANFLEFNRSYPEGWSIELLRIVVQGDRGLGGACPSSHRRPVLCAFVLRGRWRPDRI